VRSGRHGGIVETVQDLTLDTLDVPRSPAAISKSIYYISWTRLLKFSAHMYVNQIAHKSAVFPRFFDRSSARRGCKPGKVIK
jgi:hypothetical protein